jgi:hypothetical protein
VRVALVTTGLLEFLALPQALHALFPAHEFESVDAGSNQPFHGFTSNPVRPLRSADPLGHAGRLVQAALGAVIPSRPGEEPFDLAVIVEDLEIANVDNEIVVRDHVRQSARRVLAALPQKLSVRVAATLRTKVSFHLAVPMIESWFFGDLDGLKTEVPRVHWPPSLGSGPDHERFRTADPAYAVDDGLRCPNRAGRWKVPWLIERREEHPNAYLAWLLRDATHAKCTSYMEAHEGVRLLSGLSWTAVLGHPEAYPFARALVRDLETTLGLSTAPGGGAIAGADFTPTMLRNL